MYELPETYGTMDCLVPANLDKLKICIESDLYVNKSNQPCQDEDICDACIEEMAANNLDAAHNATEASTEGTYHYR